MSDSLPCGCSQDGPCFKHMGEWAEQNGIVEPQMGTMRSDPQLGYVPAIPLPFWYRGWRTWFRDRPACYQCKPMKLFKTENEYESHYVLNHMEQR